MKKLLATFTFLAFGIIYSYSQSCNIILNSGSNAQTVCLGDKVASILYNTDTGPAIVKGLPPGVTYSYQQIYCITTPCYSHLTINADSSLASGLYTYSIGCITSGTVVVPSSTTGSIYVSTSGACSKSCFANFISKYDTLQNTFTLYVDSASKGVSYNWNFGDGTTSTLTQPSHTYSQDTTYNVCLTVTTAGNATCTYCHKIGKNWKGNIFRTPGFSLVVVNTNNLGTGISTDNSTNNNFVISPNPTSGHSEIRFNKSITNAAINIYNSSGQKIIEKSDFSGAIYSVDLTNQPSGVFLVEVIQENNNVYKARIILE